VAAELVAVDDPRQVEALGDLELPPVPRELAGRRKVVLEDLDHDWKPVAVADTLQYQGILALVEPLSYLEALNEGHLF
jgi:hypothetical protein